MRKLWIGIAFSLTLCLSLVFSAPAFAQTETVNLSLDTAIDNALTNSLESVQMANTVTQLEEVKEQADFRTKKYFKSMDVEEDKLTQYLYYQYVVTPKKAANSLNSAYLSQKQLELVTRITTATAYYNVAACGLSEKAAYDILLKAQKNYKDTQLLLELGQVSQLDLMNADIQLETAKMSLLSARNDTLQAKRDLCIKMGIAADTNIAITDKLVYQPVNITDDNAAAQKLRDEDLGIQVDKYTFDNAVLEFQWADRAYSEGTFDYMISLSTYNIAEKTYQTAQNQLLSDSYQFIGNIHLAESQYLAALKNKQTIEKVYSLTELRYVNGLATQTEVLEAAAQVSEVDAALVGALLNYNMYRNAFESNYILLIHSD